MSRFAAKWSYSTHAFSAMQEPPMRRLVLHPLVAPAAVAAVLIAFTGAAHATVRTWPGGASPCDTTLQACLSGATADDTIQVETDGPIDEKLQIGKPLTVVAAPGYRPVLTAGRTVEIFYNPGAGVDWNFTLDGFGFLDGAVGLRAFSGNAHLVFRRLDIYATGGSFVGGVIGIDNFGTGHVTYEIERNRVRVNDSSGVSAIAVGSGNGGTFDGSIHDNRVESTSSLPNTAIQLIGTQAAAPDVRVYANQLSGNFATGVILWAAGQSSAVIVDNLLRSTAASSYGINQVLTDGGGNTLDVSIFNNTIAGFGTGVLSDSGITGRISGNIFAYDSVQPIAFSGSSQSEDHNLYFANGGPTPTLGTGSMIADPLFRRGIDDMRLGDGSPAIDAADSAALGTVLAGAAIPAIDADGLRRFKGDTSIADIGAFEYGDAALIAAATAANGGIIDSPLLNGNSAALPQLVQNLDPDGYTAPAFDTGLTALQYASGQFGVVDESDGGAPAEGSAYNVFVPGAGDGAFVHTSGVANVSGLTSRIDDAYTNGHPERIVLATHRATPLLDRPTGLAYASGFWYLQQLDGGDDFPAGLDFHVYAQDPSFNAFVWTAPAAASTTALDHPLLNGEPCGRVYAGVASMDAHPIGMQYLDARWTIVNLDGADIPQGAQFDVVVDEAAIGFCRYDHLFRDGFDAP
jgi:hypothetical protein